MMRPKAVLTGCWIACSLWVPFVFAQDAKDYLLDLDNMRDPFAAQLPPPQVALPVPVQKAMPVVSVKKKQPEPVLVPDPIISSENVPEQALTQPFQAGSLVVKGLVWNTQSPQAIINDQILKVGDQIQGMQIIAIERSGIELSNNGVSVKIGVSDKRK